jgi:hypothetical protein
MARARIVLAAAFLLAPSCVQADELDKFLVIGMGQTSCGQYIQAADTERKTRPSTGAPDGTTYTPGYASYTDYVDGYLTGSDSIDVYPRRTTGQATDHSGRMAWLESYCRADPLSPFVKALSALRAYLVQQGK